MKLELRAAWAIAVKELRVLSRYPLNTAASVLAPIYQTLIPGILLGTTFLVGGRAVGLQQTAGTADIVGFLIMGAIASSFVLSAFWAVGFSFFLEMNQGTLEPVWLTPTRRETFVLGFSFSSFLVSATGGLVLLVIGSLVFGGRYGAAAALAAPALVLSAICLVGVAYLVSAAVLLVKQPSFFVDAAAFLFGSLSGAMFPITVLPGAIKAISLLLPTTYAVDLLRAQALQTRTLLPVQVEYAVLGALTAVMLPLGWWAFSRTIRRITRLGTIGQH